MCICNLTPATYALDSDHFKWTYIRLFGIVTAVSFAHSFPRTSQIALYILNEGDDCESSVHHEHFGALGCDVVACVFRVRSFLFFIEHYPVSRYEYTQNITS